MLFEYQDGVARITLDRPEVLNAYSVRMRDELSEVLSAVADDEDVWALVLRGSGRAFCAGADLTEFGSAPSPTVARHVRFARDVWDLLRGLRIPKIAVLHGFVFGSGLEMALLCDVRLAAEGTLFSFPEVLLGMIPAAGGTQTLPRAVGIGPALDLLLTGRRIDAREALGIGLISEVVPPDDLDEVVDRLLSRLRQLDRRAVYALLRAVHEGMDMPLEQGLQLESTLAAWVRHGQATT